MTTIATLGPERSPSWQAASKYNSTAELLLFPLISDVLHAFTEHRAEFAVIPVYNTREGEIKEYFRILEKLGKGFWSDNIVLPITLSLGALDDSRKLDMIIGRSHDLRQCEEYLATHFPQDPQVSLIDIASAIAEAKQGNLLNRGFIASEDILLSLGLTIRERDVAPHNQTRFAVFAHNQAAPTGYDATALFTTPLRDRVGLLYDILGEFSRRGINIQDLRVDADIKSQKLQIFIETEGHIQDQKLQQAVSTIEHEIIQEVGVIKSLGSYPRVEMRTKLISTIGFIGTGDMSKWFADRLANEGYKTLLTGRTTSLTPAMMIPMVDVVIICVPISTTLHTIEQYGPLLAEGQALILLAGEAENTLTAALTNTRSGVEVMLVHNLWGPQAATMKDKNAAVVRTRRSGLLCGEFEAFLYKHGADIFHDSPNQHDLLMGVGQKLPTIISVALAMTLKQNSISNRDIDSHSTLTSLYGILAMARIHTQNPRTYAEIMGTQGDGRKIVRSFLENLSTVIALADTSKIDELAKIITENRQYLTEEFLDARMNQSLAVDETLGRIIRS